jgi:hypothetical protein
MLYRESESTPRHRLFLCAVRCAVQLRNQQPRCDGRPTAGRTCRIARPPLKLDAEIRPCCYFPTRSWCCSSPGKPCILTRLCARTSFNRPSVKERLGEPDAPDTCAAWRHGNALRLKQPTRDTYTYKVFTTPGALSRTRQAHFHQSSRATRSNGPFTTWILGSCTVLVPLGLPKAPHRSPLASVSAMFDVFNAGLRFLAARAATQRPTRSQHVLYLSCTSVKQRNTQ